MLKWEQDNEYCHSLYEDKKFVGMVSFGSEELDYDYGFWNGSFHTVDDGLISLFRLSKDVNNAKRTIEQNYFKKQTYKWWMQ